MKKVSVHYLQLILFVFLTGLLFYPSRAFAQLSPAQVIPNFTFYKIDGSIFGQKQLKKEGKILFLLFDVTCPRCQYEMQQLAAHYQDFTSTSFYFVSMDKKQQIQNFMTTYGKVFLGKNNVTVLADPNREFLQKFTPAQFPALYIYNADRKLLKYWDTSVNIDQVLRVIYAR
ncbi:MAG: peroxiredoxin family protein [Janthinobacterium lividum]